MKGGPWRIPRVQGSTSLAYEVEKQQKPHFKQGGRHDTWGCHLKSLQMPWQHWLHIQAKQNYIKDACDQVSAPVQRQMIIRGCQIQQYTLGAHRNAKWDAPIAEAQSKKWTVYLREHIISRLCEFKSQLYCLLCNLRHILYSLCASVLPTKWTQLGPEVLSESRGLRQYDTWGALSLLASVPGTKWDEARKHEVSCLAGKHRNTSCICGELWQRQWEDEGGNPPWLQRGSC